MATPAAPKYPVEKHSIESAAHWRAVYGLVVLTKLGLVILAGSGYGYLSDELYFLDAGRHLAAGYVDFPPVIAWLMALLSLLGLDGIVALRAVAGIIGCCATLLGVDLCRQLGGGRFSGWLAALVLLLAPGYLSVQSMLTMNVLDQLWWLGSCWLAVRYLRLEKVRDLYLLAVVLGLGLLTKLSIGALCIGLLLASLLLYRDLLVRPAVWWAVALIAVIASPYLYWQMANAWPLLEFISAYRGNEPAALVLQYPLLGMLLTMNPAYAVFWGIGSVACLWSANRHLRFLGIAGWTSLALFVLAGVKFYFAVPVFAIFTAAGALFWERVTADSRSAFARGALVAVGVSGCLSVPMAAPLLPGPQLQVVANFLRDSEVGSRQPVPAMLERYFPHFAEMHGWPELALLVSRQWRALTEAERQDAVLVASFYGQAGALNLLGDAGLPPAYSRHMSYHLWAEGLHYERGLFVGFSSEELRPLFGRVELRGQFDCARCMDRERGLQIFFVEQPLLSSTDIRERLRRYDFF